MNDEKDDQSILDEYGNRIPAQRRPVPAEILGEKDTQPEASRREVSNSDNKIDAGLYKNLFTPISTGNLPSSSSSSSFLERYLERKKERSAAKESATHNNTPLEEKVAKYAEKYRPTESVDLVSFGTILPRDIKDTMKTLCIRLHIPISLGTSKALLHFILENAGVIQDLNISVALLEKKELDTTKLHSPEGSTTKLQPVSNSKPGKKASIRSRLFYPAACPTTNRKQDPKECRKCSSSWPRAGCIYPEKADRKEKAYLRNHPMEAILRLR